MTVLAAWDWHSFWAGALAMFMLIFLLISAATLGYNTAEKTIKRMKQ